MMLIIPAKVADPESGSPRGQSTISFPYSGIDDAIDVVRGMMKAGGQPMSRDQLAAAMGQAPGSGSFNTKVGTARAFGVIETVGGKYQLTDLGFEIHDPSRQQDAMVTAFLSVELYKRAYDEFRGKLLPPRPHGLENAFVNFGVAPKQKERARQAFDKSARAAGFFPNGNEDRLVMPFVGSATVVEADKLSHISAVDTPPALVAKHLPSPAAGLHPSLIGMLEELPPPKTMWGKADQADWLQALAMMFRVIYKNDDDGKISVEYRSN